MFSFAFFPSLLALCPPSPFLLEQCKYLGPSPSGGIPKQRWAYEVLKESGEISPVPHPHFHPSSCPLLRLSLDSLAAGGWVGAVQAAQFCTGLSLSCSPSAPPRCALPPTPQPVNSFELHSLTKASPRLSWGSLGCIPDTSWVAASFLFVTGKRAKVCDRK